MKSRILYFSISLFFSFSLDAQNNVETFIREAQNYYTQKEYKQAQMSLQDAINEINNILAEQIAATLPAEINGLTASGNNEVNTAAMGMLGGGMQISKSYQNASKKENEADVQIVANSPMMSMMTMAMSNPAMMGQGYKSVRAGTQRAILKSEMQDHYDDQGNSKQIRVSEIQIPLSQTLITINLRGFASEAEEIAFVTKLDVEKIRTALGE